MFFASELSPRNGLTVCFVLSPVSGVDCHRCRTRYETGRIDATVAAPGPHDFAVRSLRSRPALFTPDASCVHRIPCPTFRDDREAPLRRARGVDKLLPICVIVKYISD